MRRLSLSTFEKLLIFEELPLLPPHPPEFSLSPPPPRIELFLQISIKSE